MSLDQLNKKILEEFDNRHQEGWENKVEVSVVEGMGEVITETRQKTFNSKEEKIQAITKLAQSDNPTEKIQGLLMLASHYVDTETERAFERGGGIEHFKISSAAIYAAASFVANTMLNVPPKYRGELLKFFTNHLEYILDKVDGKKEDKEPESIL